MRSIFYILFILVPIIVTSQNEIHYPFCNRDHETNSSTCYAYAMARAYPGNYCPPSDLGEENSVGGSMWHIQSWNIDEVQKGDIIIWAEHAAYVTAKYFSNYNGILVSHKPGPNQGAIENVTLNTVVYSGITNNRAPIQFARLLDIWDFYVQNNFNSEISGGDVMVNGILFPSGTMIENQPWNSQHTLSAVYHNNYFSNFKWRLIHWYDGSIQLSQNQEESILLTPEGSGGIRPIFIASYEKVWQVNFDNDFFSGSVIINDQLYIVPVSVDIINSEVITVSAVQYQEANNINYIFNEWKENEQILTTDIEYDVSPSSNTTYMACFTGYPSDVSNFYYDCMIGESIHFVWDQYPNSNVQYQIWRKVKNQFTGEEIEEVIATLPNSTTEYTDEDYTRSRTYDIYLLNYCVRTYYTPDQTLGSLTYQGLFGSHPGFKETAVEIPKSHSISNYPNPFNTATTIHYTLPEESHVILTIYDMSGKVIKELMNDYVSEGTHRIVWKGTDSQSRPLPSGMYFYKLETKTFKQTNKLLLLK